MEHTFSEKAISMKIGKEVSAGEIVIVDVDVIMATDTTAPMAIKSFRDMGGINVANPKKTIMVLDHATPCPNEGIASLHSLIREFTLEQECILYDQNRGICHQVMIEDGWINEGDIVLGADSHTCSYGAIGAFATGVGATDLGAAMLTGKTWLRVPETIRINLNGRLRKCVSAKDVILTIIGDLKNYGATYMAVEFGGDTFSTFSQSEAITVCNMAIEMGAKCAVFLSAISNPQLMPDKNASYNRVLNYVAESIKPVISCPHEVENVKPVEELENKKIDLVYLGSCTNGRLNDIAVAAEILRGKHIANGTRMIVCPASSKVLLDAIRLGFISDLIAAGATIYTPSCGLCSGTLGGVPSDGETILSTTNRNYLGRMGNNKAQIYLGSPATAATAARYGHILDPRRVIRE